jgi:ribosome-associated protein
MPITRDLALPLSEVLVRTSRSSGPGGQHANVTASRVEAVFDVRASETLTARQRERLLARFGPRIVAVAQDARSQTRNRELALERLRERIAGALHVHRSRTATTRGPRRASSRSRWRSVSVSDARTSNTASTREAVTLACWPPGPLEREVRTSTSESGSDRSRVIGIGSSIRTRV